jgi:hypothetical protein
MDQVPFHEMHFSGELFKQDAEGMEQYGLVQPGKISLVYVKGFPDNGPIPLLPEGLYEVTWIDMHTGEQMTDQVRITPGSPLKVPFRVNEAVIKIVSPSNP